MFAQYKIFVSVGLGYPREGVGYPREVAGGGLGMRAVHCFRAFATSVH